MIKKVLCGIVNIINEPIQVFIMKATRWNIIKSNYIHVSNIANCEDGDKTVKKMKHGGKHSMSVHH
jgi:glutamyl/glutaminyl-tRNA synthetase